MEPGSMPYHEYLNQSTWEVLKELGIQEGQMVECSSLFIVKNRALAASLTSDPRLKNASPEVHHRGWFSWPPGSRWEVSFTHQIPGISRSELDRLSASLLKVATSHDAVFMGVTVLEW
jgi:hypothetical protein